MAQIPPAPLHAETEHRLTALETRLDVLLPTLATKADIAEVRVAIAELKSSLLVWGITTAVAIVAILVSLLLFLAQQLQSAPSDSDSASQRMVSRLPTLSATRMTPSPTERLSVVNDEIRTSRPTVAPE